MFINKILRTTNKSRSGIIFLFIATGINLCRNKPYLKNICGVTKHYYKITIAIILLKPVKKTEKLKQLSLYVLLSKFIFLPIGAQCFQFPLIRKELLLMFRNYLPQQWSLTLLNVFKTMDRMWIWTWLTPNNVPTRSPNLAACDFFLWNYVKDICNDTGFIVDVRERIIALETQSSSPFWGESGKN